MKNNVSSHSSWPPQFLLFLLLPLVVAGLFSGCDGLDSEDETGLLANPTTRFFEGRLAYPAGVAPFHVLVGDLNRNGKDDIVTLNWTDESASVLRAAQGGGYLAPVLYDAGAAPRDAVLADLTGNGVLDLAVVSETTGQVTILFGRGDGVFEGAMLVSIAPATGARALFATDLNRDGHMDLVTANTDDNSVSVVPGQGAGAFLEPVRFAVGVQPMSVWAGDLSANGIPDIVAANYGANSLSVLVGNGYGYQPALEIACGDGPALVTAADLDQDGILDLIVGNANSGDLSILYGLGGGQFSDELRMAFPLPVGRFVATDLNGDGFVDIAAVLLDNLLEGRDTADRFAVAFGDGTGAFTAPIIYGAGWGAIGLAAADLSGNGSPDIITGDSVSNSVSIAYNRGNGTFQSDRLFPVGPAPDKLVAADFTQNGKPDIVVVNRGDSTLSLLVGTGDGAFEPAMAIPLPGQPLTVVAGDLNGDGRPDLVSSLSHHTHVAVLIASGSGVFHAAQSVRAFERGEDSQAGVLSVALGDVNNNGHLDIITGNGHENSVSVLLNDGSGRFGAPRVFAPIVHPMEVHAADLDRSGVLDLVVLSGKDNLGTDTVEVPALVRGFGKANGDFDFDADNRYVAGANPQRLLLADITGNGIPDALTLNSGDNSAYVLANQGDGVFSGAVRIALRSLVQSFATADLNKDGLADLIAVSSAGNVTVRAAMGDLEFETANNFFIAPGITDSLTTDLNGDGILDLVVLNAEKREISVLLGRAL